MRTTLNIDDSVLADAKRLAADRRTTVTALVEDALRLEVLRSRQGKRGDRPELPTFGVPEGGPLDGVDLDDSAGLRDRMDDGASLDQRR